MVFFIDYKNNHILGRIQLYFRKKFMIKIVDKATKFKKNTV